MVMLSMATIRKEALVTGEIYHIYTRSIAGYEIFNSTGSYQRMIELISYYNQPSPRMSFSRYLELPLEQKGEIIRLAKTQPVVQLIAYCLMPTHIHLVLKQLAERSISTYMNNILNSYSRYFNLYHQRKGPLWESEFKNILVKEDEQLLHLTRYIHLNPSSAHLVTDPKNWEYSSYREYINEKLGIAVCDWNGNLEINPANYRKFVKGRIAYQRSISKIKHLLIDNYTG